MNRLLQTFSKINFPKNSSGNTIRVPNSLDSDQDRHYVGPDLGPNCLQRLSTDDTENELICMMSSTAQGDNELLNVLNSLRQSMEEVRDILSKLKPLLVRSSL